MVWARLQRSHVGPKQKLAKEYLDFSPRSFNFAISSSGQQMKFESRYTILTTPNVGATTPVSIDGKPFEGGVLIRFVKSDNTSWTARFKTGLTGYEAIFDFPASSHVVVFAGGAGYLMDPDKPVPVATFGVEMDTVIKREDGSLLASDGNFLRIIDTSGELWCSERIAWDGIKDLRLENNIATGLSYNPVDKTQEWVPFSANLDTRQVKDGSYRTYYATPVSNRRDKPWWKFW